MVVYQSKANTNSKNAREFKGFGCLRNSVIASAGARFLHFAAKLAKNLPRIFACSEARFGQASSLVICPNCQG
jgi:hypothetical protein